MVYKGENARGLVSAVMALSAPQAEKSPVFLSPRSLKIPIFHPFAVIERRRSERLDSTQSRQDCTRNGTIDADLEIELSP